MDLCRSTCHKEFHAVVYGNRDIFGLAKTHLQHLTTATVINPVRWSDGFAGLSQHRHRLPASRRSVRI